MQEDPQELPFIVIPAKAGIHSAASGRSMMDPGFRRDDEFKCGLILSGRRNSRRQHRDDEFKSGLGAARALRSW
jgi:hypothetical protein